MMFKKGLFILLTVTSALAVIPLGPGFAENVISGVVSSEASRAKPTSDTWRPGDDYVLQPGDRIDIVIYPTDTFLKGGRMGISSEGNITLPLVGKIHVAGLEVLEAERTLQELIGKDFLVDPEIVIEMIEEKKLTVAILGQVKKPGNYEYTVGGEPITLLEAVSLAGGFSAIANIKKIRIVRAVEGDNVVIKANANNIINGKEEDIELEPGDVIHVMESLF